MRNILLLLALPATLLFSQTPSTQDFMQDGDTALQHGNWHDAELAFQKAAEVDPQSVVARTSLSTAIALQLHPGPVTSDENRPLIARALAAQQQAADLAPQDGKILSQLARIQDAISRASQDPAEQSQQYQLSLENERRAIALEPKNISFRSSLANAEIFASNRAFGQAPRGAANQPDGLRLSDESFRQKMASQFGPMADDAVSQAEQVIQLAPENAVAKLQSSLAYRLRAAIADSDDLAAHDAQLAKLREQEFQTQWEARNSHLTQSQITRSLLNPEIRLAVNPNQQAGGVNSDLHGSTNPNQSAPPNLQGAQRIAGKVLQANLRKKVQPIYPPLAQSAGVQGTVEFTAIIDTTGHVAKLQLVRGHPLLIEAAREAVLQWVYRPVLLNGKPVTVITDVMVNFVL